MGNFSEFTEFQGRMFEWFLASNENPTLGSLSHSIGHITFINNHLAFSFFRSRGKLYGVFFFEKLMSLALQY